MKKTGKLLLSPLTAVTMIIVLFVFAVIPHSAITVHAQTEGDYLYNELYDGTVEIIGYNGYFDEITIPSVLGGKSVTRISLSANSSNSFIKSIIIPDSVIYIENKAFESLMELTSVKFGANVEYIGERAFMNCLKLDSLDLPDSLLRIGDEAFKGCEGLTSVTIPEGVRRIDYQAFLRCTNLEQINIPESDLVIGEWVFEYTKWFDDQPDGFVYLGENDHILYSYKGNMADNTSIKIKDGTTTIAGAAFTYVNGDMLVGYEKLASVEFPSGLKIIGKRAFQGCENLTSVNIPDGTTTIEEMAFIYCDKLSTLVIPDSVTYIGSGAFDRNAPCFEKYSDGAVYLGKVLFDIKGDKSKLTSIEIKPGTITIGYNAFINCKNLKTVTIPDSVINIGEGTFYECTGLTSVDIPEGVVNIEYNAFAFCNGLKSVTIPESVKNIERDAFNCCENLKEVIYKGTQEGFNRIIMGEYVRDEISPLVKFESQTADTSEESEKSSSKTEKSSVQISNDESEITFDGESNSNENVNPSKYFIILGIIAALIIAAILIIRFLDKSKQN